MFHIFLRHLYVCLLQYDHKLDSWLGWVWHECVYSGIWQAQQVCVELPTSAINVTLLAFAAERRAANENHATIRFVCVARADGQSEDRRTPDRFVDPAPHTTRVVSVTEDFFIVKSQFSHRET